MKISIIILLSLIILIASCTSQSNQSSIQTQNSTTQVCVRKAVDFRQLIPFLPPAPPGWVYTDRISGVLTLKDGTESYANRDYRPKKGLILTEVGISDHGCNQDIATELRLLELSQYQNSQGYSKKTTIKGYISFESYQKGAGSRPDGYTLSVAINNRFTVDINTYDKTTLDTLANSINYDGIAALAQP